MKQKLLLSKLMLLLLVLLGGVGAAWAETSTVTASKVTSSSVSWTGSDGETWAVTVTGGATNQNVTNGYAQVGTGSSPATSMSFSTSGISGNISSIVVNCAAYQGKATVSATVGSSAFGTQSQSVPSWSSNNGGNVTFSGNASGEIVITMTNGSGGRAMYIKSITVTYTTGGTPSVNIPTPTFTVAEGTVAKGTVVKINEPNSDYLYYYTDDNSTPSVDSELLVEGTTKEFDITNGYVINQTTTLKVIAVDVDANMSSVASATYTIAKINPALAFSDESVEATIGQTFTTPTLTNTHNVAVSWASSEVNVATVDNSGKVTLVGEGTTTITASFDGDDDYSSSSASYILTATDPSVIILWSENFSSFSANDVPSGGTYGYVCENGGGTTKIYNESNAGGTAPELLVGKTNGTFTATVPLNNASGNLTLTYKTNAKAMSVSTTTDGISGNGSFNTAGTHTVTFTGVTNSMTSITIVFTATSSDNVRLDDIELRGSAQAVTVEAPTFSINSGTYYTAQTVGLSCATEGATIYYSTDDTSWTEYTQALNISNTTTLYAKAVKGSDESTHSSITITIAEKNDVVFHIANKSLAFEETYTITKGTSSSRDIETDGYVTVSTSNSNVVSVSGMTLTAVAVGTATITLEVTEGDTYKESNTTITLTVTAPSAQTTAPSGSGTLFNETFNNCDGNGGRDNTFSGNVGIKSTSGKLDETWTTIGNNGASQCIKLGTGSASGVVTTGNITLTGDGTLTFSAAGWETGTNTVSVSATGATLSGDTEVTLDNSTWNNYTVNIEDVTGEVAITFTMKRGFLDEVKVTDPNASAPTVPVTIASSGYGTYCCQYPLALPADNNDYKAYIVTGADASKVTFSQISGEITGGVPFILYGTAGSYDLPTAASSTTEPSNNMLRGTLAPTYLVPETDDVINFIMSGGQFKMFAAAGNLAANKAYLPVLKSSLPLGFGQGGNARLAIVFEDETTTTIQGVTTQKENNSYYNLKGQRVDNPVKGGLYLVNGKKIIIK